MSAIHVLKEGHEWGPFTTEELEGQVEAGTFSQDDLFWTDGMEDWQPLSVVIQMVGEAPAAESSEPAIYYDQRGLRVTAEKVELADVDIPLGLVVRADAQVEIRHRFRPLAGCVILAVVMICLIFLDIPRTNLTHWAIWAAVLTGVGLWWLRCAYDAFRPSRSHVAIDLTDRNERIVQIKPELAHPFADAVNRAVADHHPHPKPHQH